jgi:hypothetical protein
VPPTFEEFRDFMVRDFMTPRSRPDKRSVGQQLFNRVILMNRGCAERIRGKNGEPIFFDARVSVAWQAIEANWVR